MNNIAWDKRLKNFCLEKNYKEMWNRKGNNGWEKQLYRKVKQ